MKMPFGRSGHRSSRRGAAASIGAGIFRASDTLGLKKNVGTLKELAHYQGAALRREQRELLKRIRPWKIVMSRHLSKKRTVKLRYAIQDERP
jgi:hypothetical protein